MRDPEDVNKIISLHSLGWGSRRISNELCISRNTVKKYIKQGGWAPYKIPKRLRSLGSLENWIEERFHAHRGNAVVVHEELSTIQGIDVSLRTVERVVEEYRKTLKIRAVATLRFETPPGKQLQIDFGTLSIMIGGEKTKIWLFVATLGFSR